MLITVEKCPRVSDLLSELFWQLQLAALFISHFETAPKEAAKDFLDRFVGRARILNAIFTALEMAMTEVLSTSEAPAISNKARWSATNTLGGYLVVPPRDLLASYLGSWQHAVQYPETASFRYTRLAFWFWAQHGDPFKALMLLFDLHKAGFFLRARDMGSAVLTLCDAYTQQIDVEMLRSIDFLGVNGDEDLVKALKTTKAPHDEERVRELIDQIEDRAMEEADFARTALTADEWVGRQAALRPVVEVLAHLERQHRSQFSVTQRAIASQFEEIRADLGADALVTSAMAGRYGHPLRLKFLGIAGVGVPYQATYGKDWLDHMMEDRMLIPEALRHVVQQAYEGASLPAVRDLNLPYEWTIVSENTAWPLCVALNRDPLLVRAEEFASGVVKGMAKSLGHDEDPDELDHLQPEVESEARRQLSIGEFQSFFADQNLFGEDSSYAIEKLENFARVYPWNHLTQRELGIRFDQAGDPVRGFRHLRAAVLLEPSEALAWQSLGVVLRGLDAPDDSRLAGAVSVMLKEKRA